MSHPLARQIFERGQAEISAYAEVNGVACRVRPDWRFNFSLADLKSTVDASPEAFAKTVVRYSYDFQEAYYRDVYAAASKSQVDEFFFVVCEKVYPFATAVYILTADDVQYARQEYVYQLDRFAFCRANNHWPGYGDSSQVLQLPQWRKQEEMEIGYGD